MEEKSNTKRINVIVGFVILALLVGIGSCISMKKKDNNIGIQDIDYLNCVTGLRDWTVEIDAGKVDFLDGVQWDESYVKEVTVDDSSVDLTKEGTYDLFYLIHAVDGTAQNFEKVTVNVLAEENIKIENGDNVEKIERPSESANSDEPTKPVEKLEELSKPENSEEHDHVHDWEPVYKTVHHSEEGHYEKVKVKEAWDEEVPVYEEVTVRKCLSCEKQGLHVSFTADESAEFKVHSIRHLEGEIPGGGNYTVVKENRQTGTKTQHHDAMYEEKYVVDKPAWDEHVIDYYKCKCGKNKH